ncbi:hypothetical protein HAX54_017295, partial [Datura stramonium]|nr:hypothetical protein [Datura stramonium]
LAQDRGNALGMNKATCAGNCGSQVPTYGRRSSARAGAMQRPNPVEFVVITSNAHAYCGSQPANR